MNFRALALSRVLSHGYFRKPVQMLFIQPTREISSSVVNWKKWDSFPDFQQIFGFGKKNGGKSSSGVVEVGNVSSTGNVSDKKNFIYNFDLTGFSPKDIKVRIWGQKVVVEAESKDAEERDGFKSTSYRHYHSSMPLPKNVNPQELKSLLSSEKVLTVRAPLRDKEYNEVKEREVKIEREDK